MYLNRTFGLRLSLSELVQRKLHQKVKSPSDVRGPQSQWRSDVGGGWTGPSPRAATVKRAVHWGVKKLWSIIQYTKKAVQESTKIIHAYLFSLSQLK